MEQHPNADLVRRGFEAFATGDMVTMDQLMADDAVWHTSGDNPMAGDYVGKEAIFQLFGRFAQETDSLEQEIHDILAGDEHTVALVNTTTNRKGSTLQAQNVFVFHIEDGKAQEVWVTPFDQQETDTFWS